MRVGGLSALHAPEALFLSWAGGCLPARGHCRPASPGDIFGQKVIPAARSVRGTEPVRFSALGRKAAHGIVPELHPGHGSPTGCPYPHPCGAPGGHAGGGGRSTGGAGSGPWPWSPAGAASGTSHGQQQQPQRQHPDAQHRQERQDPADDQQHRQRASAPSIQPRPSSTRSGPPARGSSGTAPGTGGPGGAAARCGDDPDCTFAQRWGARRPVSMPAAAGSVRSYAAPGQPARASARGRPAKAFRSTSPGDARHPAGAAVLPERPAGAGKARADGRRTERSQNSSCPHAAHVVVADRTRRRTYRIGRCP